MLDALALVVLALVFATFVLAFQGVFLWIAMRREEEEQWTRRRLGLRSAAEMVEDEANAQAVSTLMREQAADQTMNFLGEYGEQAEITLRAAGSEMTVSQLLGQCLGVGALVGVGAIFMMGTPGVLAAPIAAMLPYAILKRNASLRADAMLSQMPDALELMSRTMSAGTGLADAFRMASEEMPEPLAFEFGRVYEEVRFGKEWRDTLADLIDRNPTLFDLRLFVSSMLLQRETGGNMIETLSNISKTIRNRYVFDAKVVAMTSEARASGLVLAGMPIGVVILVLVANPGYLSPLVEESLGHIVIMLCCTAYGTGLYMMRVASRVEV